MNNNNSFTNKYYTLIHTGEVFKSYKDLCNRLNEPIYSGNSKIAQLKQWYKFFNYKKDGYKIIITDVYQNIKVWQNNENIFLLEDKRNSKSEIQSLMSSGLLSVLNCYNGNNVQLSYKQLFEIFGMVNSFYGKISIPNLKVLTNMQDRSDNYIKLLTSDLYTSVSTEFKRILERTFKSLQKQKVLIYMPGYNIIEKDNTIFDYNGSTDKKIICRCASKDEISYILGVEGRVLQEFGLRDSVDLFMSHRQKEYYDRVTEILLEEQGWLGVYQIVDVVFNPDIVKHNYDTMPLKYKMNEISVKKAKKILRNKINRTNQKVLDYNEETGEIMEIKENMSGSTNISRSNGLFHYGEEYITDIDKIIDVLIKISSNEKTSREVSKDDTQSFIK